MSGQKKFELVLTSQFKKDVKRLKKRGYKLDKLYSVINLLLANNPLPDKFKDHSLVGEYIGFRECHIEPDWLLIYSINSNELLLTATRSGTHSDLFE